MFNDGDTTDRDLKRFPVDNVKAYAYTQLSSTTQTFGDDKRHVGEAKVLTVPGGEAGYDIGGMKSNNQETRKPLGERQIIFFALFRALSRKALTREMVKFLNITIRSKVKRFSRLTRKIHTPALCATVNLTCE